MFNNHIRVLCNSRPHLCAVLYAKGGTSHHIVLGSMQVTVPSAHVCSRRFERYQNMSQGLRRVWVSSSRSVHSVHTNVGAYGAYHRRDSFERFAVKYMRPISSAVSPNGFGDKKSVTPSNRSRVMRARVTMNSWSTWGFGLPMVADSWYHQRNVCTSAAVNEVAGTSAGSKAKRESSPSSSYDADQIQVRAYA